MSNIDLLRILAAELRYVLKWVPRSEAESSKRVLSMYESSVSGAREADSKVCANCRYGSPFSHTPRYLRCRLNPPVVIMNPGGSLDSAWPTVERDDWCSRWMSSDSSPD